MKKMFSIGFLGIAMIIGCSSASTTEETADLTDRVLQVNLGHVNVYFIRSDEGYILVDAGMPDKEKHLDEAFSAAGIQPHDVKLIIITHAHPDHSGGVAYAKEITGAEVICHESAAQFIQDGVCSPIIAQNFKGKVMNLFSPKWKYQGVKPEILVKEEFDLHAFGLDGAIIHTPGHTEDSITIVLDSGEMLLGDLVRGRESNISLGQFYEDKTVLLQSLAAISGYKASKIYMSHGSHIDSDTLQQLIDQLKREI